MGLLLLLALMACTPQQEPSFHSTVLENLPILNEEQAPPKEQSFQVDMSVIADAVRFNELNCQSIVNLTIVPLTSLRREDCFTLHYNGFGGVPYDYMRLREDTHESPFSIRSLNLDGPCLRSDAIRLGGKYFNKPLFRLSYICIN